MNKVTNAIIIMDGYGNRAEKSGNAIAAARTPNLDRLTRAYPTTEIEASGRGVGLPTGQMGNSEVGHLNLGAGRVVYQDITRIDKAIEDGEFFTNVAFMQAVAHIKDTSNTLHLVGLLSSGGVHSSDKHLYALLDFAKRNNITNVAVHCLMDGRDVPPNSGIDFLQELQTQIDAIGVGYIATIIGRYYFMDRDNNWDRVKLGYDAMYDAIGSHSSDAQLAITESYASGKYDEFVAPTVIGDYEGVEAGDSVIFFNFRSDRAREISQAIMYPEFDKFMRAGGFKKVFYVGMTQYDAGFTNIATAFNQRELVNTFGEYLARNNLTQARVAETEKYAHVTFFFNGGVEAPNEGEIRIVVPSPKVATYDLQPSMSADKVCEMAIEQIGKVDVLIVNFANCDMVGHTGMITAATMAVETVDECVGKLVDAILANKGSAIVTADHGNAEQMSFADGSPCTSHTAFNVPMILVSEQFRTARLASGGKLADVVPTFMQVIELEQPKEMDGISLIK